MSKSPLVVQTGVALALLLFVNSFASAQATRTWVSGVGDDANPCSRTAPCKTFAGAISKTAAGGEISVLDPGGFGAVTITKSITINGEGTLAGILAAGQNGIIVNTADADKVTIRNVSINGAGNGLNGIRFVGGGSLHVERCQIYGFGQRAIDFQPNIGNAKLFVRDSVISNNISADVNSGGVFCKPTVAGSGQVVFDGVKMERNKFGMRVENRCSVMVSNSTSSRNDQHGFFLLGDSGTTCTLNLENCIVNGNVSAALHSEGANAIARISNVTCLNNAIGLEVVTSGQIVSFKNNRISGNPVSAAPTSSIDPL